jgi:hypothetical protein
MAWHDQCQHESTDQYDHQIDAYNGVTIAAVEFGAYVTLHACSGAVCGQIKRAAE